MLSCDRQLCIAARWALSSFLSRLTESLSTGWGLNEKNDKKCEEKYVAPPFLFFPHRSNESYGFHRERAAGRNEPNHSPSDSSAAFRSATAPRITLTICATASTSLSMLSGDIALTSFKDQREPGLRIGLRKGATQW